MDGAKKLNVDCIEYGVDRAIHRFRASVDGGEWKWLSPAQIDELGFDSGDLAKRMEQGIAQVAADLSGPHNNFDTSVLDSGRGK